MFRQGLLCHSQEVGPDYIAAFACTGGIGCHEQRKKFEDKGEIDQAILLEAGLGQLGRLLRFASLCSALLCFGSLACWLIGWLTTKTQLAFLGGQDIPLGGG